MIKMIEKIRLLKESLENDDEIDLINFNVFGGISDSEAKYLQEKFNMPERITNFYRFTNGLQLRWMYKKNISEEQKLLPRDIPFDWMWPSEHYQHFDGLVNILPASLAFKKNWKDIIWFEFESEFEIYYKDKKITLIDFKKKIIPFDLYDKYFTVAFYTADNEYPLLFGVDHNVEFLDYQEVSFEKYMDFIFEKRGEVKTREFFFRKLK
jgi:hypothetical protein